jgi:hypothetical protein
MLLDQAPVPDLTRDWYDLKAACAGEIQEDQPPAIAEALSGPQQVGDPRVLSFAATTPAVDYLTLSKMLATTIGTNMLQLSQAIAP